MKPIVFFLIAIIAGTTAASAQLPTLKISDNHRFLITADGKPFFWLGDLVSQ